MTTYTVTIVNERVKWIIDPLNLADQIETTVQILTTKPSSTFLVFSKYKIRNHAKISSDYII